MELYGAQNISPPNNASATSKGANNEIYQTANENIIPNGNPMISAVFAPVFCCINCFFKSVFFQGAKDLLLR